MLDTSNQSNINSHGLVNMGVFTKIKGGLTSAMESGTFVIFYSAGNDVLSILLTETSDRINFIIDILSCFANSPITYSVYVLYVLYVL